MKAPTLAAARKALRAAGDPDDAAFLQRFFKTKKGEYGEGDRFSGHSCSGIATIGARAP